MARSTQSTLVLLLITGALALGGIGLFLALSGGSGPTEQPSVAQPTPAGPRAPEPEPVERPDLIAVREATGPAPDTGTSTVAWPVSVKLELVRAAHLPNAKDAPPLGSGRRSQITGVVLDPRGAGVPAELEFIAGPNRGRVLQCNSEGEYGATDLYPGLSVVQVRGPGIPGSVREARLRQDKTKHLSISYSLPGSVVATVYDSAGEPLADVDVMLDGQPNRTNELGEFHYTSMTAGLDLALVLKKPGYAHYGGVMAIPAGRHVAAGRYKFALDKECALRISIAARIGGPEASQVVVLPSNTGVARTYPWYSINPVEVQPGGSVRLDGLPPVKVLLRAFHEGAVAVPEQRAVSLTPGTEQQVELHFEPAPQITGRVVDTDDRPIPGARVSVEAPDRVAATMFHLRELPMFLETEVMPTLPPAAGETVADDNGQFLFSAWSQVSPVRYVVAESPDGSLWGSAVVRSGAADGNQEVVVRVAPVTQGRAELRVDFPGRHQAVPVEIEVEGAPREPRLVPVQDVLHVTDLAEGTWRMRVSWQGEHVFGVDRYDEFELGPGGELRTVKLPQGAIDGQDEDTRSRAGNL